MSKYNALWQSLDNLFKQTGKDILVLSFEQIEQIIHSKIDHSFLQYKKELESLGCSVDKISLKQKQIIFRKI